MIQFREKINAWPKWMLLIIASFTLITGFSGFAHNHAPGLESPDCPAYFIQHYSHAEFAITVVISLFLLLLSLLPQQADRIVIKTFVPNLSSRAPPVSY